MDGQINSVLSNLSLCLDLVTHLTWQAWWSKNNKQTTTKHNSDKVSLHLFTAVVPWGRCTAPALPCRWRCCGRWGLSWARSPCRAARTAYCCTAPCGWRRAPGGRTGCTAHPGWRSGSLGPAASLRVHSAAGTDKWTLSGRRDCVKIIVKYPL